MKRVALLVMIAVGVVGTAYGAGVIFVSGQVFRFDAPLSIPPAVSSAGNLKMYFKPDAGLQISAAGGPWTQIGTVNNVIESDGGVYINPPIAGEVLVNGNRVITEVGGTFTGSLVSSGVTCDVATGTNENWQTCVNGTGKVLIQGTAVASGAGPSPFNGNNESPLCVQVSDNATDQICIMNISGSNSQFSPMIMSYSDSSYALTVRPMTSTDTGSNPLMLLQFGLATTGSGLIGAIGTRPLLTAYNYVTTWLQVENENSVTLHKALNVAATTPTALAGNVNDYAGCTPTNAAGQGGGLCRIDSGGVARNITGLSGGRDGQIRTLCAVNAAGALTLKHQVTSTAANQFKFSGGTDRVIAVDECRTVVYDSTATRWRERL